MNTLQIKNLKKTYPGGVTAINEVSLEISNGMFGLLGPNGAGKSSLMRTIATLQKPDSGAITFNGIDVVKDPLHIRKQLGYLPQDFGVYPKISAFDLLDHLAVLKGVAHKKERREQICNLLEQTNLQDQRNKAVHRFSGGMRQRFGIAQALLGDPKIIIVDEPTAGLDPEERNRFNNLLSEIGEQVIVILSTHIVEDVRDLCTSMAIIVGGSVIMHGSPSDLISRLDGSVWARTIGKEELDGYQKNMNVLSSRFHAGKINIHVHSSFQPGNGFSPIAPSLEDVYFNTLFTHPSQEKTYA
jgi:ABC-2 type transport system ATP-binding protein